MTAQSKSRASRVAALLSLALSFALFVAYAASRYEPYTFALYDSGWHVHQVRSIAHDGDIDLRNQLHFDPQRSGGVITLGANGEWYPIHESLLAFLAVPFYLFFGINGCLFFNLLLCSGAVLLLHLACSRDTGSALVGLSSSSLIALTSLLVPYSYDFSIDVLGAFLLLCSLWAAVSSRPAVSGLLWGLAIFGRMINVVSLPGFLLLAYYSPALPRWRWAALFLLSGLPFAALLLLMNHSMFGDALTFRYSRWAVLNEGALVVTDQWAQADPPAFNNFWQLLVDREKGIFVSQPLIAPVLALGLPLMFLRNWPLALSVSITWVCYLGFFASYTGALNSTDGNRYFMYPILLCAFPLAYLFRECESGARSRQDRCGQRERSG